MATADKASRRAKFEGVFAKIRDELIKHFAGQGMPQDAVEWYRNVRAVFYIIMNIFWLIFLFFHGLRYRISNTMYLAVNSIAACPSLIPLRFLKAAIFPMTSTSELVCWAGVLSL